MHTQQGRGSVWHISTGRHWHALARHTQQGAGTIEVRLGGVEAGLFSATA
jgi:hypothetical protein